MILNLTRMLRNVNQKVYKDLEKCKCDTATPRVSQIVCSSVVAYVPVVSECTYIVEVSARHHAAL